MHYKSFQEQCPAVVSVVSPELTLEKVWIIESDAHLGKDCDYTVYLTSSNGTGGVNSIGTYTIS